MHPLLRLVLSLPPHLKLVLLIVAAFLSIPVFSSLLYILVRLYGLRLRAMNERRRRIALATIGTVDLDIVRKTRIVGFFHPYCNAGGGGERVLWTAVAFLQKEEPDLICVVYTGDLTADHEDAQPTGAGNESKPERVTKDSMISKVKDRFGIALDPKTLIFVRLGSRRLVEDSTWPRFTLLGQSLGSIILAWQGLGTGGLIPDIWIDTMGYAFTYPLIRHLGQIPVGSYTHYPTISADMLRRVSERKQGHTNTSLVASSAILTHFKLLYYVIFAELYSICLRQSTVLMVNSTWTKNHIDHLLKPFGYRDDVEPDLPSKDASANSAATSSVEAIASHGATIRKRGESSTSSSATSSLAPTRFRSSRIVYPPCDTVSLSSLPLQPREPNMILSLAQFRPEKDHPLQLKTLSQLFHLDPSYRATLKLIIAGSVRHASDSERVQDLRKLAQRLGVEENVEFVVNASYEVLKKDYLGKAGVGLHTMVDEHFGITVVEFMAAGLLPLVHASAGPLLDIVVPSLTTGEPTGFHAKTASEFASQLRTILSMDEWEQRKMRELAREQAQRFGVGSFEEGWLRGWNELKGAL
ncbi:BQ2448_6130 [Microbotryum intermedium]|uniref:GDP-Man:Man(3)GlcNAc(2)-PP-Dol alpha-1,2-mannosyltransferase n=1 Tax=Microbotryum intermedium TaxID=269621 RepID=A0A238FIT4_9BASI|nr:BQ2448_6130 [Microbotryum intermedium]